MKTYVICLTATKGKKHFEAQAETSLVISCAGSPYVDRTWVMGQGDDHHWKIRCTDKQITWLLLSGARVVKNVTDEARVSGLAKLTKDEMEALGLSK